VADTIYWTAPYDYAIRGAPLAGGTVEELYDSAQGVNLPMGLAIDPVGGRICWANYGDSTIRGAPLAAGGTVEELYGAADGVSDPFGVAIDPAAEQIYWTNGEWSTAGVAGTIRRAPLDVTAPL
jgi:DNA-binding beta-propeller fold protein YncE